MDPWAALSYWRRSLQQYRYGQFIFGETLGVLSILLQTVLLMGVILPVVRRWRLRAGSLTLVFTLNAVLVAFLQGYYAFVLVAVTAGIIADVLLKQMSPPRVKPLEPSRSPFGGTPGAAERSGGLSPRCLLRAFA